MNVSDLREILQYVPRFRERIFVIAVDGAVAASENFPNVLLDIAVLRSLSIKVVLVHGAGRQIEALSHLRGVVPSNTDGSGITDAQTLQVSIDAAIRLTNEIMEGLSMVDLRAAYANAIIAHPAGILGGKDFLFTGHVERVDSRYLSLLLQEGVVPVIPPLGFDGEGRTYRVNSDTLAEEVAEALHATKVIYLCTGESFVVATKRLPRQISVNEIDELLRRGAKDLPPGIISKLRSSARVCRQGVARSHLLNGEINEALLTEIFSNDGIGCMVHSNEYQQIRKVLKKDVRALTALIRESVSNEELIRRTRGEILERIEDYWILEVDRNPVACVALHVYPEESVAELACLYVKKNYENQGYGRKLMGFVENLARRKGIKSLFALSTRAFNYLQQKGGFREATVDILPGERRVRYDASGRHSKVLVKSLESRSPDHP